MNVWYFNHYAGGPGVGKFMRAYHLSRAWAEDGHVPTIFVARFHHLLQSRESLPTEFTVDGIRYITLAARHYRGNGFRRILNMIDYCFGMLRLSTRKDLARPDVVIVSSPHPLGIFPAWRLARRYNAKLVFEVRDIWPLSIVEINGTGSWHPFVLICTVAERFAYRVSDLVASLLGGAEEHMRPRGLTPGKFIYAPNGVDPSHKAPRAPLSNAGNDAATQIDVWHRERRLVIIHPGAQGKPNALDRLLEAIAILVEHGHGEKFGLLLIGQGGMTEALKRRAAALNLTNVRFFPTVPQEEARWLISKCDIGYAGARNIAKVYRYGISFNKVLDFMEAGIPVILPLEAKFDPVSKAQCGIVTGADGPQNIAEAILQLLNEAPATRVAIGRRGQVYARRFFNYRKIARTYAEAIERA